MLIVIIAMYKQYHYHLSALMNSFEPTCFVMWCTAWLFVWSSAIHYTMMMMEVVVVVG